MLPTKDDINEDGAINKNGRLYNVQRDDDENEVSNTGHTSNIVSFKHRIVYLLLALCYLPWTC